MTTVFKINKICDKILCDKNIRIVAVSHRTDFFFKSRRGIKIYQTKQEIEKSLADAALRWVSRRSLLSLGKPIYAMAKYEKVKRITIPFGRYGIILCTINKDSDADLIATQVIKILKTYKE
ncbi:MAG: hypothetical protein ACREBI_04585 [Nitrosotalea sp.]